MGMKKSILRTFLLWFLVKKDWDCVGWHVSAAAQSLKCQKWFDKFQSNLILNQSVTNGTKKKAFSDISQNFFALISSKENNLKKIENVWADMLVAKLKSNSLLFIFSLCKGGAQYAPWF